MSLFRPNIDCLIRKRAGTNVYGEEVLSQPIKDRCTIIAMRMQVVKTSVRADTSATRGAAREFQGEAKILFPISSSIDLDDQIEVTGYKVRVTNIFPRHNINGVLDHFEIEATIWGKE